jgi:AmmeMemoRadiSam system protein A
MPDGARGAVLVAIARNALEELRPAYDWSEDWLRERAATFVTLRIGDELRGCIGTLDPHRALGDDVAHNAHAAAYRDSRFEPLSPHERARVRVEVSVLSPREGLQAASEEEALRALRPGLDGISIEYQEFRATFLPQVWDNLPDPLEFLCELRRKASLPARFWHPQMKIARYTVEKYR